MKCHPLKFNKRKKTYQGYKEQENRTHKDAEMIQIIELVNQTSKKLLKVALAGVAQWIECQPANQRVAGLTPSQVTCLGCSPGPQWEVHGRQLHIDVSLSPSPSVPLSLKINKIFLKIIKSISHIFKKVE